MSAATPIDTKPASRISVSERAVNALTQAIHDGIYTSGQRLTEVQLAGQLGVSRGSLREALRRVAAKGLIELEPNRGAIVKRISRAMVMDVLSTREVLEGLAARLAARRMESSESRGRAMSMREHIVSLQTDSEGVDFLEDNIDFHRSIVELSGNQVLHQQVEQLQLPGLRSRFFSQVSPSVWRRSLSEHLLILDAILDGDSEFAEQAMKAHVRRTRRLFNQLPESVI